MSDGLRDTAGKRAEWLGGDGGSKMNNNNHGKGGTEMNEITLRDITSDIRAWLDTLEGLEDAEPDQREAALAAFAQSALVSRQKIDNFAAFVTRAEAEAEFSRAEAKRLELRAKQFDLLVDRLKEYARVAMRENNLKKLAGDRFTLARRSSPPAVQIEDESALADRYKSVLIATSKAGWDLLLDLLAARAQEGPVYRLAEVKIDKAAIKRDLQAGAPVTGADLTYGEALQIK